MAARTKTKKFLEIFRAPLEVTEAVTKTRSLKETLRRDEVQVETIIIKNQTFNVVTMLENKVKIVVVSCK